MGLREPHSFFSQTTFLECKSHECRYPERDWEMRRGVVEIGQGEEWCGVLLTRNPRYWKKGETLDEKA